MYARKTCPGSHRLHARGIGQTAREPEAERPVLGIDCKGAAYAVVYHSVAAANYHFAFAAGDVPQESLSTWRPRESQSGPEVLLVPVIKALQATVFRS